MGDFWKLTVPCRFCGRATPFKATRECTNCHEVRVRLEEFVKSQAGLDHATAVIEAAAKRRDNEEESRDA